MGSSCMVITRPYMVMKGRDYVNKPVELQSVLIIGSLLCVYILYVIFSLTWWMSAQTKQWSCKTKFTQVCSEKIELAIANCFTKLPTKMNYEYVKMAWCYLQSLSWRLKKYFEACSFYIYIFVKTFPHLKIYHWDITFKNIGTMTNYFDLNLSREIVVSLKINSFSKTRLFRGSCFLKMFYTINLSPLLVTK